MLHHPPVSSWLLNCFGAVLLVLRAAGRAGGRLVVGAATAAMPGASTAALHDAAVHRRGDGSGGPSDGRTRAGDYSWFSVLHACSLCSCVQLYLLFYCPHSLTHLHFFDTHNSCNPTRRRCARSSPAPQRSPSHIVSLPSLRATALLSWRMGGSLNAAHQRRSWRTRAVPLHS